MPSSVATSIQKFRAKLEPVPHGGQYVVVPLAVAKRAGLKHAARVRGTVDGAPYRSALMMYSGVFHLGLHKPALAAAGVRDGARVTVTIEADEEPLPTDHLPDDLARALARNAAASAAWKKLAPSRKRVYVKALLEAKKPETRARRLARTLELLT